MTDKNVSDSLLEKFDNLVAAGDTMPIAELKKRYEGSPWIESRHYLVYHDLLDLPVTVDMLVGPEWDSVRKVVAGLRELHGDGLMFTFGGYSKPRLTARVWKSDEDLRKAWKEFAESEYKSANLTAVKGEVA